MFSKEKTIVAYTVEKCKLCGMEAKRKFKEGDFLFATTSKCNSCDGLLNTEKIFGETLNNISTS
ncbi:MAG: hypothetical protein HW410_130 [Nitrosarchaeum sp.]|jgi:hypothetical protein|nr:hypothetical protein [Nitrosarchaeum sp.]